MKLKHRHSPHCRAFRPHPSPSPNTPALRGRGNGVDEIGAYGHKRRLLGWKASASSLSGKDPNRSRKGRRRR